MSERAVEEDMMFDLDAAASVRRLRQRIAENAQRRKEQAATRATRRCGLPLPTQTELDQIIAERERWQQRMRVAYLQSDLARTQPEYSRYLLVDQLQLLATAEAVGTTDELSKQEQRNHGAESTSQNVAAAVAATAATMSDVEGRAWLLRPLKNLLRITLLAERLRRRLARLRARRAGTDTSQGTMQSAYVVETGVPSCLLRLPCSPEAALLSDEDDEGGGDDEAKRDGVVAGGRACGVEGRQSSSDSSAASSPRGGKAKQGAAMPQDDEPRLTPFGYTAALFAPRALRQPLAYKEHGYDTEAMPPFPLHLTHEAAAELTRYYAVRGPEAAPCALSHFLQPPITLTQYPTPSLPYRLSAVQPFGVYAAQPCDVMATEANKGAAATTPSQQGRALDEIQVPALRCTADGAVLFEQNLASAPHKLHVPAAADALSEPESDDDDDNVGGGVNVDDEVEDDAAAAALEPSWLPACPALVAAGATRKSSRAASLPSLARQGQEAGKSAFDTFLDRCR